MCRGVSGGGHINQNSDDATLLPPPSLPLTHSNLVVAPSLQLGRTLTLALTCHKLEDGCAPSLAQDSWSLLGRWVGDGEGNEFQLSMSGL